MKNAYLTIDDSPSERMGDLIDLLQECGMPAVFFCIGQNLERYPQFAIKAIRAGFLLGNHSWSHPHFSKLSIEQAFIEIQKTDALLDALYQEANIVRPTKCFRFPYGDKGDGRKGYIFKRLKRKGVLRSQIIQTLLRGLGYTQPAWEGVSYSYYQNTLGKDADWHWTYDIMEWSVAQRRPNLGIRGLPQVLERLNSTAPPDLRGTIEETNIWMNSPSDEIILLHDHKETAHLMPAILNALRTKDLVFRKFEF